MAELGKRAGYSHASGLQRFENPEYAKDFFSLDLARRLEPHLVGKGSPPITRQEFYLDMVGEIVPDPNAPAAPAPTSVTSEQLVAVTDVEVYKSRAGQVLVRLLGPNNFLFELPLRKSVAAKLVRELCEP